MSQRERGNRQQKGSGTQPQRPAGDPGNGAAGPQLKAEHKWTLIQALMNRCYMKEDACKKLVRRVCGTQDDSLYKKLIPAASQDLKFAQLALKIVKEPVKNINYVGLVNLEADECSKVASSFSIPQRDYFKAVMEKIACSSKMAAGPGTPVETQMELLHVNVQPAAASQAGGTQAPAPKKLSMAEKEATLNELMNQGWLHNASLSTICLGPRTFLELGETLLHLPDLPEETATAWRDLL